MESQNSSTSIWPILAIGLIAGVCAAGGYFLGKGAAVAPEPKATLSVEAEPRLTPPKPASVSRELAAVDSDRDDTEEPERKRRGPWGMGNADLSEEDRLALEERAKRFENMPQEQKMMFQRAMRKAWGRVDGFEEVGEAMRKGEIDPKFLQQAMSPAKFMEQMDEVEVLAVAGEEAVTEAVASNMQQLIDEALANRKPKAE